LAQHKAVLVLFCPNFELINIIVVAAKNFIFYTWHAKTNELLQSLSVSKRVLADLLTAKWTQFWLPFMLSGCPGCQRVDPLSMVVTESHHSKVSGSAPMSLLPDVQ